MASEERGKLWGGRFREPTHPSVERFSASIGFDRALARYDIRGSLAHAQMLGATGLIPEADARAIVAGLEEIGREIEAGRFPFDEKLEDIHMNVEARLRDWYASNDRYPQLKEEVGPDEYLRLKRLSLLH